MHIMHTNDRAVAARTSSFTIYEEDFLLDATCMTVALH